jgi:hypothetical protein
MARQRPYNARDESGDTDGVVLQFRDKCQPSALHENFTRTEIAKRLATVMGYSFAGEYEAKRQYDCRVYLVPDHTVVSLEAAHRLGIQTEYDFFGGVVPHPFVAGKTITHPLVRHEAVAPEGWSHSFPSRVSNSVLFGFSAFSIRDAIEAIERVLERGRARIKPAWGVGGCGQCIISRLSDVYPVLDNFDPLQIAVYGLVVEQNYEQILTYSVGQVRVGQLVASYYGTQLQTKANDGTEVYGGSDLVVARGDYNALLALAVPADARIAIQKARLYETAAAAEFPGWLVSRRNYDVARVTDSNGTPGWGVLEQSWRIGGASAAEVEALDAFRSDPTLSAVRASCREVYGTAEIPRDAIIMFEGIDDRVGRITKYTVTEAL